MSELISGKEALIALANGKEVMCKNTRTGDVNYAKYQSVECIQNGYYEYKYEKVKLEFYLKPRTITINGVEVPAPFEPKGNCMCYSLYTNNSDGYVEIHSTNAWEGCLVWRTKTEIKQVVAALRSVFKPQ